MLLNFLAVFVLSANKDFDPDEMLHYKNDNCAKIKLENGILKLNTEHNIENYYRECKNIEVVSIGDNVKTISNYLFYGSSIKRISDATKLTSIGIGAFAYCVNLQEFTFGNLLTSIGEGAFCHSQLGAELNKVNIGGTLLTTIGASAFEGCPLKGTIVTISANTNNNQEIGNRAFYKSGVAQLNIPQMNRIGEYAFADCNSLTSFNNQNNIKVDTIDNYAFLNSPLLATIDVTSTSIGDKAFYNTRLTIRTISQKLTNNVYSKIEIGQYAFSGRIITGTFILRKPPLTDRNIINQFAFYRCTFQTANTQIELHSTDVGSYAFSDCNFEHSRKLTFRDGTKLKSHAFELSYGTLELQTDDSVSNSGQTKINHLDTIPAYAFCSSSVTSSNSKLFISGKIEQKAFYNCSKLTGKLEIDASSIEPYAFANCPLLNGPIHININEDGGEIQQGAFELCTSEIKELNITANDYSNNNAENHEISIDHRAFFGSGLSCQIVLHSFIESIGEHAFANCKHLTNQRIIIYAQLISPFAFANCGRLVGGITIFSNTISFHSFDNNEIGQLTIDGTQQEANANTESFYGIHFTGEVIIKENVVISNHAFSYSTFDEDITIDSDSIGNYAFSPCNTSRVKNIHLSIGNTDVNDHAFEYFGKHTNPVDLTFHYNEHLIGTQTNKKIGPYAFHEAKLTENLVIPYCFNLIGECAFCNCFSIKHITINFDETPNNDISPSIGNYAFKGCSEAEYLSLNSNGAMKSIGKEAFYFLGISNELALPTSITTIGQSAFEHTSIPKLIITHESALTTIEIYAFANCTNLEGEVFVPKSVKYIKQGAFKGCIGLSNLALILEGDLEEIGEQAFYDCASLSGSLDIPYKVSTIGKSAFANCTNLGEHLTFKSNRNSQYCSIGDFAFYRCRNLKQLVQISCDDCYKISSIGNNAFENSGLYGDIYIPNTLESIGAFAFKGCSLGKISWQNGGHLGFIGESAFQDSTLSGDLDMPQCISIIGKRAFANCKQLGKLTFKESHSSWQDPDSDPVIYFDYLLINENAFYGSSVTGKVDIPSYVKLIGDSAFENCKLLTELSFKDGSSTLQLLIGKNAFKGSTIAKELELPSHLLFDFDSLSQDNFIKYSGIKDLPKYSVGDSAFADCQSLTDIVIKSGTFGSGVFENCVQARNLYMTGGTLGEFNFRGCRNFNGTIDLSQSASIGKNGFAQFREQNFTLYIYPSSSVTFGERAFYNSTLTGPLSFNGVVSSIGREAFAECTYLLSSLSITFDNIGKDAFSNTVFNGSMTAYFPSLTTTANPVGPYYEEIFKGATGFTNLYVRSLVSSGSVPDYAFAGMPFEESVLTIYSTITTIGKYAFSKCNFYSIVFYQVTSITVKDGAFSNCEILNTTVDMSKWTITTSIPAGGSTTTFGEIPPRVFSGCRNLPSVIFPAENLIDRIGNEAFYGCSSLSFHLDFFLNPKLKSIGKRAFSGCTSLRGPLEIPSNLYRIEEYAFAGCTGLTDSLTIQVNPDLHAYIGPCAFKDCEGFKKGKLYIFINDNEEDIYQDKELPLNPYYKYDYFLIIGNEAFEKTKFKDIYYNGRFQPDCDYDIGFSSTKGIHTSSNFVNKSFCNYPLHSSKLSGGAIAGITIACIVVVAAIVLLVLFLICRNKKNKDNSEDEVEMNADP